MRQVYPDTRLVVLGALSLSLLQTEITPFYHNLMLFSLATYYVIYITSTLALVPPKLGGNFVKLINFMVLKGLVIEAILLGVLPAILANNLFGGAMKLVLGFAILLISITGVAKHLSENAYERFLRKLGRLEFQRIEVKYGFDSEACLANLAERYCYTQICDISNTTYDPVEVSEDIISFRVAIKRLHPDMDIYTQRTDTTLQISIM